MFSSKLSRDEDGNPHAYHEGGKTAEDRDPGLDHICNGMSVLELIGDQLRNKYSAGGSGGSLTEGTKAERHIKALACKRDFIALRDAGFPACGVGHLCGYFYGFAASERACGFPRGKHLASDPGCGVPITQTDAQGHRNGFYLSTNKLLRPGAGGKAVQTDYADALTVPFIVMPGRQTLPDGAKWEAGDLAVVSWHGHLAYAVVGDSGPPDEIGEASRALLDQLGKSDIEVSDPATTVLLLRTSAWIAQTPWPITGQAIRSATQEALSRLPQGIDGLKRCGGFEALP